MLKLDPFRHGSVRGQGIVDLRRRPGSAPRPLQRRRSPSRAGYQGDQVSGTNRRSNAATTLDRAGRLRRRLLQRLSCPSSVPLHQG